VSKFNNLVFLEHFVGHVDERKWPMEATTKNSCNFKIRFQTEELVRLRSIRFK